MEISSNCVYKSFNKSLASLGLKLSTPEFFIAYGGQDYYSKLSNSNTSLKISACHYSNMYLEKYFGLKFNIVKITFEELIKHVEKGEKILIALNCYYLPFDKLNYRKNFDEHWLYIKGRDLKNEYLFEDNKYSGQISEKSILEANCNGKDSNIFTIAIVEIIDTEKFNNTEIEKRIKLQEIQSLEFENLLMTSEQFFQNIKSYLKTTSTQADPLRTINIVSLSKELLKPNSVLYAKYIQAKFAESFYCMQDFFLLYTGWTSVVKKLLHSCNQFSLKEINEILNDIDFLMRKEISLIKQF